MSPSWSERRGASVSWCGPRVLQGMFGTNDSFHQPEPARQAKAGRFTASCRRSARSSGDVRAAPDHFSSVTSVMPFTRLLASSQLPSRVTDVLRTMLPPPGIAQLWNFSVLGSKRTTVFGVEPDSLYQMTSLIAEIP